MQDNQKNYQRKPACGYGRTFNLRLSRLCLAVGLAVVTGLSGLPCSEAQAAANPNLPDGFQSIVGNVKDPEISASGKTMWIKGDFKNNVIAWDSFNVGKGNDVQFLNGNFLNIVKGKEASHIKGLIYSDGGVYIVNPHGVTLHKGSRIHVNSFGISTAKPSEKLINDFIEGPGTSAAGGYTAPELFLSDGKGMGKVKLLGTINTNNLVVDGSNIVIRNAARITTYGNNKEDGVILTGNNKITLQSSTGRIDVGTMDMDDDAGTLKNLKSDFDPLKDYTIRVGSFSEDKAVIVHKDEIPLADKEDFELLSDAKKGGMNKKYWLADDVDLGTTQALGKGETFRGSLDGAYNHLTYTVQADTSAGGEPAVKVGLFKAMDGATVKNLLIYDAKVSLEGLGADKTVTAGALSGNINNSHLENVEVSGINVITGERALQKGDSIGALAGSISGDTKNGKQGSKLVQVMADFDEYTASALSSELSPDDSALQAGAVAGSISDQVSTDVAVGLNGPVLQASGYTGEIADPDSFKLYDSFGEAYADLQDTGKLSGYVMTATHDGGHQSLFLKPFFVENDEWTYGDKTDNYRDFNKVTYTNKSEEEFVLFDMQEDFVDFNNNPEGSLEDGLIKNAGLYEYALKNDGPDGFYFVNEGEYVKGDNRALETHGYFNVHKRDLQHR